MPVEGRGLSSRPTQDAVRDREIGRPSNSEKVQKLQTALHAKVGAAAGWFGRKGVATAPEEASAAIASDVRRSRRRATRASASPSRSTPEPAVSCAAYRENSEQPTAGAFAADVVGSSLDSPLEGTGFEPSVPPRKRRSSREAPRPTIVVSRDDLCLRTQSRLSIRHLLPATAERPFTRAGPMVRIRFPPAASLQTFGPQRELGAFSTPSWQTANCPHPTAASSGN